jgi:hypothetical protein
VDPNGNYYSQADNNSIHFLFDTVTSVIETNVQEKSPNYVNTIVNLINEIKSNYDLQSLAANDTTSSNYFSVNN